MLIIQPHSQSPPQLQYATKNLGSEAATIHKPTYNVCFGAISSL